MEPVRIDMGGGRSVRIATTTFSSSRPLCLRFWINDWQSSFDIHISPPEARAIAEALTLAAQSDPAPGAAAEAA